MQQPPPLTPALLEEAAARGAAIAVNALKGGAGSMVRLQMKHRCQGEQLHAQRRKRRYMEGLLHAAVVPTKGGQRSRRRSGGTGSGTDRAGRSEGKDILLPVRGDGMNVGVSTFTPRTGAD